MLTLYSMPSSGNSYKVRLLLALLAIPFRVIETEYDGGKELTKTPEFRAKNPHGRVPLVVFEDGRTLSESNAILLYFGDGTRFVPQDRYARAKVHEWMFWEQNSHEGTVAVRAAVLTYPHRASARTPEIWRLLEGGHRALGVMEAQLAKTPFLAGDSFTAADICLYAYTHSAGVKGGFDLGQFPAVQAWLCARLSQQPGHVPLEVAAG